MRGTFVVNGPPSVAIVSPTAGTSWTGATQHSIVFSVADESPPESLTVWVNYSYAAGAFRGVVQGPFPGRPNPISVAWTTIHRDVTDIVIEVTAIDERGLLGFRRSPPFEIDATPPRVASSSPAPDETGVALNARIAVTWSEPMNRTATEAAFSLRRVSDIVHVVGSLGWSADARVLTFSPAADLEPTMEYEVLVEPSAKDDSDPGHFPAAPIAWRFLTGTGIDEVPPVVSSVTAVPSVQDEGSFVNITAEITDDVGIAIASAHIVGTSFEGNFTMARASDSVFFSNRSYGRSGTYAFTVWAEDSSGNVGSLGGSFQIVDVTPPPAPSNVTVHALRDGTVHVGWTAVDAPDLLGYHVYRRPLSGAFVRLTGVPVPPNGQLEFADSTAVSGVSYAYAVTAIDDDGNESPLSAAAVLPGEDGGGGPGLWVLFGAVVAVQVAAVGWFRRASRASVVPRAARFGPWVLSLALLLAVAALVVDVTSAPPEVFEAHGHDRETAFHAPLAIALGLVGYGVANVGTSLRLSEHVTRRRIALLLALVFLYMDGVIHWLAVAEHLSSVPSVAFFVVVGAVQVVSVPLALRRERVLWWVGVVLSVFLVLLFVVTRVVAPPFAVEPEPVETLGLLSKGIELALLASLAAFFGRRIASVPFRRPGAGAPEPPPKP
ncbi:MAG: Ig-like domain-containing protein, partial [Euryarchaeota archaeon]|nr:Ig-like domain-containing protein [Euryarchaeota archaeon]